MTTLTWEIKSEGGVLVEAMLRSSSKRAADTRPVMDKIVADMLRVERVVFDSQGRRGGGSWADLKPDTVRKKGTTTILRTAGARPGYSKIGGTSSDDTLYKSLTDLGAPYQILDTTKNRIAFGTDRPYAEVISGQRPIIKFMQADTNRWMGIIAEHLMQPFIRAKSTKGAK